MSKTDANLQVALAGEADANRRYIAYGIRALSEGRPDVAKLFFEAAAAETQHALNFLKALKAIRSTEENLRQAATGEALEIDEIYPRMIREAEEEGRKDAAEYFRVALEGEKEHREIFRKALEKVPAAVPPASKEVAEIRTEPERIERLSSIREIMFGAQDGLVSTFAVVAGMTGSATSTGVIVLAGAVSALAGILSMSIGSYLSSRAQRQVYEAEIAQEKAEIAEKPGEEAAELMAALVARGMTRADSGEVVRRVAQKPELMLHMLSMFELGLAPENLGNPVRDALVMGLAFGASAAIPILPFLFADSTIALGAAAALTLSALFLLGMFKGKLAGLSKVKSGIEVLALGAGSGLAGFALGRLFGQAI